MRCMRKAVRLSGLESSRITCWKIFNAYINRLALYAETHNIYIRGGQHNSKAALIN